MNTTVLLTLSAMLNLLLAAICWRSWRGRRQTNALMHVLLKKVKTNSATIRRLKLEPWADEHLRAAEDAVDAQFSIIHAYLNPHDQIVILDDTDEPIPHEPGTDAL